ncbi:acetyl-CoA carboxylase biotin carboxyl carrier protein subunit [Flavobacteriaceae bacterium AU392]|nr:acetyl-CoA carboxylase biotin carboxyl carrier protein subunit [Flavobacteriaceae bacterium]RKM85809.1 acetyl-CoA carboxylase biotin carboxyl carrier protein subunit [Flavobacteriaceae bacterium AU392]
MSETYKTKVNNSFEFEVSESDLKDLDSVQVDDSNYHILHNNSSYKAEIISVNYNKRTYTILVNGAKHEVVITNQLDQLIKEMGFEVGAGKQVNDIKAPMPGLILEVSVSAGQEIQENDPLLILEAMKMENSIISPRDGVIKSIAINKGDAVEKNQLLIEFE